MTYLGVLVLFVFFASLAMTINEGLWSNMISLVCIILGSLIAWHWGLALGEFAIAQVEPAAEYEWALWFASLWGVFFFSATLLRVIADRSSRIRMKFIRPVDMGGGILLSLAIATLFSSFTAYSLYIPFQAGVWKTESGASWAQSSISTLARPMYSIGKAFHGVGFPDLGG
jgi:hypothetical protein